MPLTPKKVFLLFMFLMTGIICFPQSQIDSLLTKIDSQKLSSPVDNGLNKSEDKSIANSKIDSTEQKIVQSFNRISEKSLRIINNKYSLLQKLVERKTEKMLRRMQKKEVVLQEKMKGKDSVKAQQLFANVESSYQQLYSKLHSPTGTNISTSLKGYLPGIDSMLTAMKFLSRGNEISGISNNKLQQVQAINQQIQQLQGKLQVAGEAQDYIRQREQELKNQLTQYGLGKQLLGMNKEVYYYQEQLSEYKNILNSKEKMEQTVLGAVREIPAFQTFWQKYSIIGQLFPMPANFGTTQVLNGLQTRANIQNILQSIGGSSTSSQESVQQQIQQAKSTFNQLKNKVAKLGGTSGTGDMSMPDFVPNKQHTKRFLQRFEYGFNIQNTPSTRLLPNTFTIALTLGYRINDKATTGIGCSYMMGWGKSFSDIKLTNQGVGLRSFLDIKTKRSIWVTGGFEYTYYQEFTKFSTIKNLDVWQKSALIGLTKKIAMKKKTANIQILYDLLYNREVPKAQPFVFRIGYNF